MLTALNPRYERKNTMEKKTRIFLVEVVKLFLICNLVKQKLRGNIACESEQGKGVLFRVEVPIR